MTEVESAWQNYTLDDLKTPAVCSDLFRVVQTAAETEGSACAQFVVDTLVVGIQSGNDDIARICTEFLNLSAEVPSDRMILFLERIRMIYAHSHEADSVVELQEQLGFSDDEAATIAFGTEPAGIIELMRQHSQGRGESDASGESMALSQRMAFVLMCRSEHADLDRNRQILDLLLTELHSDPQLWRYLLRDAYQFNGQANVFSLLAAMPLDEIMAYVERFKRAVPKPSRDGDMMQVADFFTMRANPQRPYLAMLGIQIGQGIAAADTARIPEIRAVIKKLSESGGVLARSNTLAQKHAKVRRRGQAQFLQVDTTKAMSELQPLEVSLFGASGALWAARLVAEGRDTPEKLKGIMSAPFVFYREPLQDKDDKNNKEIHYPCDYGTFVGEWRFDGEVLQVKLSGFDAGWFVDRNAEEWISYAEWLVAAKEHLLQPGQDFLWTLDGGIQPFAREFSAQVEVAMRGQTEGVPGMAREAARQRGMERPEPLPEVEGHKDLIHALERGTDLVEVQRIVDQIYVFWRASPRDPDRHAESVSRLVARLGSEPYGQQLDPPAVALVDRLHQRLGVLLMRLTGDLFYRSSPPNKRAEYIQSVFGSAISEERIMADPEQFGILVEWVGSSDLFDEDQRSWARERLAYLWGEAITAGSGHFETIVQLLSGARGDSIRSFLLGDAFGRDLLHTRVKIDPAERQVQAWGDSPRDQPGNALLEALQKLSLEQRKQFSRQLLLGEDRPMVRSAASFLLGCAYHEPEDTVWFREVIGSGADGKNEQAIKGYFTGVSVLRNQAGLPDFLTGARKDSAEQDVPWRIGVAVIQDGSLDSVAYQIQSDVPVPGSVTITALGGNFWVKRSLKAWDRDILAKTPQRGSMVWTIGAGMLQTNCTGFDRQVDALLVHSARTTAETDPGLLPVGMPEIGNGVLDRLPLDHLPPTEAQPKVNITPVLELGDLWYEGSRADLSLFQRTINIFLDFKEPVTYLASLQGNKRFDEHDRQIALQALMAYGCIIGVDQAEIKSRIQAVRQMSVRGDRRHSMREDDRIRTFALWAASDLLEDKQDLGFMALLESKRSSPLALADSLLDLGVAVAQSELHLKRGGTQHQERFLASIRPSCDRVISLLVLPDASSGTKEIMAGFELACRISLSDRASRIPTSEPGQRSALLVPIQGVLRVAKEHQEMCASFMEQPPVGSEPVARAMVMALKYSQVDEAVRWLMVRSDLCSRYPNGEDARSTVQKQLPELKAIAAMGNVQHYFGRVAVDGKAEEHIVALAREFESKGADQGARWIDALECMAISAVYEPERFGGMLNEILRQIESKLAKSELFPRGQLIRLTALLDMVAHIPGFDGSAACELQKTVIVRLGMKKESDLARALKEGERASVYGRVLGDQQPVWEALEASAAEALKPFEAAVLRAEEAPKSLADDVDLLDTCWLLRDQAKGTILLDCQGQGIDINSGSFALLHQRAEKALQTWNGFVSQQARAFESGLAAMTPLENGISVPLSIQVEMTKLFSSLENWQGDPGRSVVAGAALYRMVSNSDGWASLLSPEARAQRDVLRQVEALAMQTKVLRAGQAAKKAIGAWSSKSSDDPVLLQAGDLKLKLTDIRHLRPENGPGQTVFDRAVGEDWEPLQNETMLRSAEQAADQARQIFSGIAALTAAGPVADFLHRDLPGLISGLTPKEGELRETMSFQESWKMLRDPREQGRQTCSLLSSEDHPSTITAGFSFADTATDWSVLAGTADILSQLTGVSIQTAGGEIPWDAGSAPTIQALWCRYALLAALPVACEEMRGDVLDLLRGMVHQIEGVSKEIGQVRQRMEEDARRKMEDAAETSRLEGEFGSLEEKIRVIVSSTRDMQRKRIDKKVEGADQIVVDLYPISGFAFKQSDPDLEASAGTMLWDEFTLSDLNNMLISCDQLPQGIVEYQDLSGATLNRDPTNRPVAVRVKHAILTAMEAHLTAEQQRLQSRWDKWEATQRAVSGMIRFQRGDPLTSRVFNRHCETELASMPATIQTIDFSMTNSMVDELLGHIPVSINKLVVCYLAPGGVLHTHDGTDFQPVGDEFYKQFGSMPGGESQFHAVVLEAFRIWMERTVINYFIREYKITQDMIRETLGAGEIAAFAIEDSVGNVMTREQAEVIMLRLGIKSTIDELVERLNRGGRSGHGSGSERPQSKLSEAYTAFCNPSGISPDSTVAFDILVSEVLRQCRDKVRTRHLPVTPMLAENEAVIYPASTKEFDLVSVSEAIGLDALPAGAVIEGWGTKEEAAMKMIKVSRFYHTERKDLGKQLGYQLMIWDSNDGRHHLVLICNQRASQFALDLKDFRPIDINFPPGRRDADLIKEEPKIKVWFNQTLLLERKKLMEELQSLFGNPFGDDRFRVLKACEARMIVFFKELMKSEAERGVLPEARFQLGEINLLALAARYTRFMQALKDVEAAADEEDA
ncbi:hypothetical protein AUK40_01690 [Candidatus Wirthbacteria bacterium CG2_30_54_11]|uniref:Uncharacterized protein n=1 Tax=Candidatus Wirthbacteria bacterium CG2_30_54_11 TaxID=1817892 RepID=A0A1J5J1E3_9BACT|nr:MAG: hypothetical protein AUK40_01690 [Candidatus Wirthbacteria bacterium CG2_30_54_11]